MKRTLATLLATGFFALLAPSLVAAQERAGQLDALIGSSAAAGEAQLTYWGYENVGASRTGDSSFTYWRQPRTARCLVVRTTNGLYASLVFAPDTECQEHQVVPPPPPVPDTEENFATVCGVEAEGKTFRYRCRARYEGCKGEGYCRTIVTYPDNELRIVWGEGERIEVTARGTSPVKTTFSVVDGQTRFVLSGRTYLFYRVFERAQREVANFKD